MIQFLFNLFLLDIAIHLGIFGLILLIIMGVIFVVFTAYHLAMAMFKAFGSIISLFNLPRIEISDNKPRIEQQN